MKIQKFTKNRKAELTTKQLVMIIILIASFIIVLFLLFRLNLGETTVKEVCHNSVVLKGRSPLGGSLDCRTNYLCISGGEDCEGIPTTSTIEVDPNKEETKNETMKALADEMSDCWWMFGEGKIDYAGRDISPITECSICSIVEFDEKLKESPSISYQEFYDYLRTTSKTSSQTYLQYLYSTGALNDIEKDFPVKDYIMENLEFGKTYFILTGMSRSIAWGLFGSNHFPVVILEKTQENYDKIECDTFLTKA
jgi:hypothetical protein